MITGGLLCRAVLVAVFFGQALAGAPATGLGTGYEVTRTFQVGGEGRWDYIAVDPDAGRLYLSRSSHVQVLDEQSGKLIADWPDTPGVHGVAIDASRQLAFTSNGGNDTVSVIDLKNNTCIASVKVGSGPDSILYDPSSDKVLVFNHKGGTVSFLAIGDNRQVDTTEVKVGGALEEGAVDSAGHAFVNVEDKNEVVELDTKTMKVMNHWPVTGGEGPTGLSIDVQSHRLFIGCGENNVLAVMDCDSGKVLGTFPIGQRCDGCKFDPEQKIAFASCGDGTITAIRQEGDQYVALGTIPTKPGARTICIDSKTHQLFLPTAEFLPSEAGKRPAAKPGSFQVLVVGQTGK